MVLHVRDKYDLVLYFKTGGDRIGEFVTLLARSLYLRHRLMQVHVKHPITFRHNGHKTLSLVRGQTQAEPMFIKSPSQLVGFRLLVHQLTQCLQVGLTSQCRQSRWETRQR